MHSRKHTRITSRPRHIKIQSPVLIRDNGLLHISPRYVVTPDANNPTLLCPLHETFVVFMSPPIWSGKGMGLHMPLLPHPASRATDTHAKKREVCETPRLYTYLRPGAVWMGPAVTCICDLSVLMRLTINFLLFAMKASMCDIISLRCFGDQRDRA